MGDTKQNTPISAQITALRLKPERISFCDRFADIERKPTLSNMIKQVQITDRKVSGMLKRTSINCKIHINLFFFYQIFCGKCHSIFRANSVLFLWLLFQLGCISQITFYWIAYAALIWRAWDKGKWVITKIKTAVSPKYIRDLSAAW